METDAVSKRMGFNRSWIWVIPLWLCMVSLVSAQQVTGSIDELLSGLSKSEREFGQGDSRLLPILDTLAKQYERQNDLQSALQISLRALSIEERNFGSQQLGLVPNLIKTGRLYYLLGDKQTGISFFEKSFLIHRQFIPPEDPIILNYLRDLSITYLELKDYGKALPYLAQALEIKERVQGLENLGLLDTLYNLSDLHAALGNYPKALDFAKRGLRILERNYSQDHLQELATFLIHTGRILSHMGDDTKGFYFMKLGVKLAETKLGPMPPEVASGMLQLDAFEAENLDNKVSAVAKSQEGILSLEKQFGQESSKLVAPIGNLAYLYARMGQLDKAFPLSQRSLRLALQDSEFNPEELSPVLWGCSGV